MKRILLLLALLLCLWGCTAEPSEPQAPTDTVPMTAVFADTATEVDHLFIAEQSEFTSFILFTAGQSLRDVQVYSTDFVDTGHVPAQVLYAADAMEAGETLLGGVVFWGDLTAYGVSYTDAQGNPHAHLLFMSGKDGSLIMEETPTE